ncbi:hypothetical protein GALMADRAFT_74284 [Galerina marginata CBS 339.88]|uniref:Uncharacterized protein n=1 Tax=Galerina marginata (strain CBS 339.88) TaxID=685588 RepID=A0A067SZ61_GALM3|nr:hypothetical protein GALMADRAFT_74284 [Galerina marginata CBS 339.88]
MDLILREALNRSRKLSVGDEVLSRLLQGIHATRSSAKHSNPDHTNPIRHTLISATLLQTHLPGKRLTSRNGISNILSWMGTGQGYRTTTFLESIMRPEGFYSSTLADMIDIFQVVADRNAAISAQHPEHPRPQDLPGVISVDDMLIWGQPNHYLSAAPTKDRMGDTVVKFTLQEKFSPYWTEEIQSAWVDFLGEMLDQDPLTYSGPRRSWTNIIDFLQQQKIVGFGSGLTPFQLANHLAALKIVDAPSAIDIANWISQNKKLGAHQGLSNLGFHLDAKNAMSVHCAFMCIYRHFEEYLTAEDKAIVFFSPIFVEHILCKVTRWTSRLASENAEGHLEKLASEAEASDNAWKSDENLVDSKAFPVPMIIAEEFLKKVIEQVGLPVYLNCIYQLKHTFTIRKIVHWDPSQHEYRTLCGN